MSEETQSQGAQAAVGKAVAIQRAKAGEQVAVPGWADNLRLIYVDDVKLPGGFEPTEKWWQLDTRTGKAAPLPPGSATLFDDEMADAKRPFLVSTIAEQAKEQATSAAQGAAMEAGIKGAVGAVGKKGLLATLTGHAGVICVGTAAAAAVVTSAVVDGQMQAVKRAEIQSLAEQPSSGESLAGQIEALTSSINQNAVSAERDALAAIGAAEDMRLAVRERESELAAALAELSDTKEALADLEMKNSVDEQAVLALAEENLRLEATVETLETSVTRQIEEVKAAVKAVTEQQGQDRQEDAGVLPQWDVGGAEEADVLAEQRLEEAAETIALLTATAENLKEARAAAEAEKEEANLLNADFRLLTEPQPLSPSNAVYRP